MLSTDDAQEPAEQSETSSRGDAEHRLPPKRILVVNDTQEILELFDELLTEFGHKVTLMSYAPNELDRIKQARPELIIVDFILGGREMDGWQLLQKLKMDRQTERLPVIVCTAAIHEVREQEGYLTSQGIVVLLKPFSIDQLAVALESVFAINENAIGTNRPSSWTDDLEGGGEDERAGGAGDGPEDRSGQIRADSGASSQLN